MQINVLTKPIDGMQNPLFYFVVTYMSIFIIIHADLCYHFNCSATSVSLFAEDVRTDHLSASMC